MSQQTQVSRVVEYHQRWIARWPTVQVRALCCSCVICWNLNIKLLHVASSLEGLILFISVHLDLI